MKNVFQFGKNSACELRSSNHFQRTKIQTEHCGSESIKTLGAKIIITIIIIIEKKIKDWTPQSCLCRLCRLYIGQIVFINSRHLSNLYGTCQNKLFFYIYLLLNFMYTLKIHKHVKCRSFLYNCSSSIYCKNIYVYRI